MSKTAKKQPFAGLLFEDCSIMWCDPAWHKPNTGQHYLLYWKYSRELTDITYGKWDGKQWKDFVSGKESADAVLFYSERPNAPSFDEKEE